MSSVPRPTRLDSRAHIRQKSGGSSRSTPTLATQKAQQDEAYRKDMHLVFVRNALQQKAKGRGSDFDQLVSRFNPNNLRDESGTPSPELSTWVAALTHVVSGLDRVHASLVDALVSLPWTTMDTPFVRSYTSFIGMLVSARPEYLHSVLSRIASGFTLQSGLKALNLNGPESSSSPMTRRIIYDRLHALLQHLLSLIPTLPSALQPLLVKNFPHKRQDKPAQVTYIRNLLRIATYCNELGDKILATVIDRAIQIDVEIQVELDDLDEVLPNSADGLPLDPFDSVLGDSEEQEEGGEDEDGDGLSDISSEADSVDESGANPNEESVDLSHVVDMVSKLDAILKLVFDHFQQGSRPSSPESDRSSPPELQLPARAADKSAIRSSQFFTLLAIFDRTIIKTFKSRYTQFLVFWYSSLDPEFADLFQGLLVSKALFENDQPVVTRAAAASYIASYVSRALFIDRESARQVIGLLCQYLSHQLDLLGHMLETESTPSIAQFTLFYAVAQAVFLTFCFRWRDFLSDGGGGEEDMDGFSQSRPTSKKWIPALDVVERVVTSPLNPLKVCSVNVVRQFARVAQTTGFIYCHDIIENNKRSEYSLGGASLSASPNREKDFSDRTGGGVVSPAVTMGFDQELSADLQTFFPFDPYKLPTSSSYIQGIYRDWSSVALEDEDDDDDEDDDEDADALPYDKHSMMAVGSVEAELGQSFEGMSISPVRPLAVMG